MSITLEDLKAHCERTIEPNGKIAFDMTSKVYQEHAMVLALINEHEKNRWIPVTERLPETEKRLTWFITTTRHGDVIPMQWENTTVRGKDVSRWVWQGRISPWEVIAWMPLPKPFKEGEI